MGNRRRNHTSLSIVCDAWSLIAGRMVWRKFGNSNPILTAFGIRMKMTVKQDRAETSEVWDDLFKQNAEIA